MCKYHFVKYQTKICKNKILRSLFIFRRFQLIVRRAVTKMLYLVLKVMSHILFTSMLLTDSGPSGYADSSGVHRMLQNDLQNGISKRALHHLLGFSLSDHD